MSRVKTLRLTALDTLFFREPRPFDVMGGSELVSVFPPPPRTVLGAMRTAVGEALGVDWTLFRDEAYVLPDGHKPRDIIGYGDNLGGLALKGLWLSLNEERLYPAPVFLLHRKENERHFFTRLYIGSTVETRFGTVPLPEIPGKGQGWRLPERAWLTRAGLENVLRGGVPGGGELYIQTDLFTEEPRLGIARDNCTRTVENSLLYQTCHIRPKAGLAIEADISGLNDVEIEKRIVRLGGEGRMAEISSAATPRMPVKPDVKAGDTRGLIVTLLTPARFENKRKQINENEKGTWLPEGFKKEKMNGADVWRGEMAGIALTLHAAALGKAQREGGWDLADRKPRSVQSLIPAGNSYYCTVDDENIAAAIDVLHGNQVGKDQKFGRGVIACGLWNAKE